MDRPAEEQMIRLRLADLPVVRLDFDLPGRRLTVDHGGEAADVLQALIPWYGAGARPDHAAAGGNDAAQ